MSKVAAKDLKLLQQLWVLTSIIELGSTCSTFFAPHTPMPTHASCAMNTEQVKILGSTDITTPGLMLGWDH